MSNQSRATVRRQSVRRLVSRGQPAGLGCVRRIRAGQCLSVYVATQQANRPQSIPVDQRGFCSSPAPTTMNDLEEKHE